MAIGEHLQPGYGPVGLAASDGFPWPRLVTGVFAVAISLSMSWPGGRPPADWPRAGETPPAPTAAAQVPRAREFAPPTQLHETPSAPAQAARAPATRAPSSPGPRQLQSTTARAKVQSKLAARKHEVNPWAADYSQIAHMKLRRSRSEVRSEYLATREQVAAFTGEDSGSAYLSRVAARQRAARAKLGDHKRHRSQASRVTPARSHRQ